MTRDKRAKLTVEEKEFIWKSITEAKETGKDLKAVEMWLADEINCSVFTVKNIMSRMRKTKNSEPEKEDSSEKTLLDTSNKGDELVNILLEKIVSISKERDDLIAKTSILEAKLATVLSIIND